MKGNGFGQTDIISCYSPRQAHENHEKPQVGLSVSELRFETRHHLNASQSVTA
jgi:hypothetical protein